MEQAWFHAINGWEMQEENRQGLHNADDNLVVISSRLGYRDRKAKKSDKEDDMAAGTLYVVATPIGNLEDITLRALRILKTVGLIAAEDTRRTRILLDAYGISSPVTSLHDFNEVAKSASLLEKLDGGMDVAYVSDAGTPGISDPGFFLVREAIGRGIAVVPVPGPVAAVAALCVSGLPLHAFVFQAFLPSRRARRRALLASLATETRTLVFYESPHRLRDTLADLLAVLGDRPVVVAREVTKLHEEFLRGSVQEVLARLEDRVVKGEVTLLVGGAGEAASPGGSDEVLRERLQQCAREKGLPLRGCVVAVCLVTGAPRKRGYTLAIAMRKEGQAGDREGAFFVEVGKKV
jgi:16S rRNA (cytidine1402-2'-O)-methyltransferase